MYTDAFEQTTLMDEKYPDFCDKAESKRLIHQIYGRDNLRYKSPVGHIDIIQDQHHLTQVFFNDASHYYEPPFTPGTELLSRTKDMLDQYFDGEPVDFREIPVKMDWGSRFEQQAWNVMQTIPHGEVRSYKWIGTEINRPRAARAVGNAAGKNWLSIIVPCHRVIRSDGSLGKYGGGTERKRMLLAIEGYVVEGLN